MDTKLLSICIPTFNGAERITRTLDCIIKAIGNRKDIEVVVSDNASTDNTFEVLKEYEDAYTSIKVYRNEQNLGFNCNMIKLIDEYATGQYSWVIGDDDFLDTDSIDLLAPLLVREDVDYVSVNFRTLNEIQYKKFELREKRDLCFFKGSYYECLDKSASLGNILGTFMSVHVFKSSFVRAIDKTELKTDVWNTYETIFPNSFLMLEAFDESNNCYYIKNKLFTGLDYKKNYSSKWVKVVDGVMPQVFDYTYKKCNGRHPLKRSKLCLYDWGLRINTIRFLQRDFEHVSFNYFLSPKLFVCLYNHVKEKIDILFNINLL